LWVSASKPVAAVSKDEAILDIGPETAREFAGALKKAGTSPSPYQEPSALVTTGPYLRTRNPIYFAFAWIYLGLAAWMNSPWAILLFPGVIIMMKRLVITREEAVLESRFGENYLEYKARTRRWM
jgi:protein-S-isoprenylcysteine O-methyltransferase Ste14